MIRIIPCKYFFVAFRCSFPNYMLPEACRYLRIIVNRCCQNYDIGIQDFLHYGIYVVVDYAFS